MLDGAFMSRGFFVLALVACAFFAGCGRQGVTPDQRHADRRIKFIMSDRAFNAEIGPILRKEVAKLGFVLDWIVVNDIIQPNKMVDDGSADAAFFQHEPYFDRFVVDHMLTNVVKGFYTTFVPSGLYSRKHKSLDQLPVGATVAIPVDPANNGRALFMLRDHGLIEIRNGTDVIHASAKDVTANRLELKFKEVDQLMLQNAIEDVDVGFLFAMYAIQAGFDFVADALAVEDVEDSPYKGIVVIRKDLVAAKKIEALRVAFSSEALKSFYRSKYGKAVVFLDDLN
jgi:D-methionine transport system substrate-binding protein